MSDRAPSVARFFYIPNDEAAAEAASLLAEHGFHEDRGVGDPRWDGSAVRVGTDYWVEELCLGYPEQIAKDLKDLGMAFRIQQDPKYEYDGCIVMVDPELGRFDGTANAEGQVYLTDLDVDRIIATVGAPLNDKGYPQVHERRETGKPIRTTMYEIIDALNAATGKAWRDKFTQLDKENIQ